ncbi:hypothetical protein AB0L00_18315 [Actinoallomurus sp. NPDC052308]|uniref:hypothetical protein n=1 Tax=Actinoallomurus sp. NPDC052308 TaxID=3155530 RepID=UPI003422D0E9
MTVLHQVAYTWREKHSGWAFGPRAATLPDRAVLRWTERLGDWLRTDPNGSTGYNHFYGVFRNEAVFVRRIQRHKVRSAKAWLLIGPPTTLTPRLALELREWSWLEGGDGRLLPLGPDVTAAHRRDLQAEARHPEVLERLVALMSRFLSGAGGSIVLPPTELAYPLLWGFQEIVGGFAVDEPSVDRRQLAFETFDDRTRPPFHPGLFVRFRKGAPDLGTDHAHDDIARLLVADFARKIDGAIPMPGVSHPGGGATEPTVPDAAARPASPEAPVPEPAAATRPPGRPAARTTSGAPMPPPTPSRSADAPARGREVICPICLSTLAWNDLPLYRYNPDIGDYTGLDLPADASAPQRAVALRTAFVRCTDPREQGSSHYLPFAYGMHGPPAVFGFVGATRSGKTHLLTAMIGQLEKRGLGLGVRHAALDKARHQAFLNEQVSPFFNRSEVIEQTRAGTVGLVDSFLVSEEGREARPVALFDVAGGDLLEIESARRFLDVADGLIFVVNAAEIGHDELGDRTFGTVLELLQGSGRLPEVSAAVVLNKADLVRFDEPIVRWFRSPDQVLDAEASLRESADVYAYLHSRGADAWTRPYRECRKATLHVVSAAGSDAVVDKTFVRGVTSRRVLNPLLALMAMTGLLTSPEAQKIGV